MVETTSAASRSTGTAAWSPGRIYLVASGVFLLFIAASGFFFNASFPTAREDVAATSSHLWGIFETNGWHNLAGLISGLVALGFAIKPEWARAGALFKGGFYVVVTASVAIWGGETFLIAANFADQIIHGTLAVTGLVSGFLTPRAARRLPGRAEPVSA